jgi:hypothetical protein
MGSGTALKGQTYRSGEPLRHPKAAGSGQDLDFSSLTLDATV